MQPEVIFNWKDSETDAIGWVVFDRVINGVTGGGIFMHPNATMEETADIARNMTINSTLKMRTELSSHLFLPFLRVNIYRNCCLETWP